MTRFVGSLRDDRGLGAARWEERGGRDGGGDWDAQRGAEVGGDGRVDGCAGQFGVAAVGAGFIAAQPVVADVGGGTGPFAGVRAQFLANLGAGADRRRADVRRHLGSLRDDRGLGAARRFGGAGRVGGGDFDAQRGAEVGGHDRVAGFAGQFDRAAVGAGFIAAQPLVAEAGGGTGPFAGVRAQFLANLGAAADRRRADVRRHLGSLRDDRGLGAARRFGGAGRVGGGDFDAQRGAEVGGHDRVAGFAGQFDRAAVGAGFIAAQPLVAEAGGGTGPFAGVRAQF